MLVKCWSNSDRSPEEEEEPPSPSSKLPVRPRMRRVTEDARSHQTSSVWPRMHSLTATARSTRHLRSDQKIHRQPLHPSPAASWRLTVRLQLTAFNNKTVCVRILAVNFPESCFVVSVEEIFLSESLDFVVEPVEQVRVSLGNGRSNSVQVTQRSNFRPN